MNTQMYLPTLISVGDLLRKLQHELPFSNTVDMTIVVNALFEKIFYDNIKRFGQYEGPFGAYRQQVQNTGELTDYDVDLILHQAEIDISDLLGSYFPDITTNMKSYIFHYPGGENQTNMFVYIPVNPNDCPADYRGKLLPYHAVRYTRR